MIVEAGRVTAGGDGSIGVSTYTVCQVTIVGEPKLTSFVLEGLQLRNSECIGRQKAYPYAEVHYCSHRKIGNKANSG